MPFLRIAMIEKLKAILINDAYSPADACKDTQCGLGDTCVPLDCFSGECKPVFETTIAFQPPDMILLIGSLNVTEKRNVLHCEVVEAVSRV